MLLELASRRSGVKDPDRTLQHFCRLSEYLRERRVPWRRDAQGRVIHLRCGDSPVATQRYGENCDDVASHADFSRALQHRFADELTDFAVNSLASLEPESSAKALFEKNLAPAAVGAILVCVVATIFFPLTCFIFFNIACAMYFTAVILFRAYLAVTGANTERAGDCGAAIQPQNLPSVTILAPMFREAEGLPAFVAAMYAMDYPPDLLDIKIILEEGDAETADAASALVLDKRFDVVITPKSHPQTKPKACNYALQLTQSDLVVIYDAEDAPEPDQLKKAAGAFATADESVVCVQAKLNYYNRDENWLTRLFALEYALWFDNMLPALQRLRAPIPLGGTSNIFRTAALKAIGGWDPYNVTEDADLGLRIARKGFRTELINSTTFEEATCTPAAWMRQRSRWMKGYAQTWLVDMRKEGRSGGASTLRGAATIHLFLAGTFFGALINPVLWLAFVLGLATQSAAISSSFPAPLVAANLFTLLAGNALFIILLMVAPRKRGWSYLAPAALLAPAYWVLTSAAAYRALWQLLTRPSFWEKTRHGVSIIARRRLAGADIVFQNIATRRTLEENRPITTRTIEPALSERR